MRYIRNSVKSSGDTNFGSNNKKTDDSEQIEQ